MIIRIQKKKYSELDGKFMIINKTFEEKSKLINDIIKKFNDTNDKLSQIEKI